MEVKSQDLLLLDLSKLHNTIYKRSISILIIKISLIREELENLSHFLNFKALYKRN